MTGSSTDRPPSETASPIAVEGKLLVSDKSIGGRSAAQVIAMILDHAKKTSKVLEAFEV